MLLPTASDHGAEGAIHLPAIEPEQASTISTYHYQSIVMTFGQSR